MTLGKDVSPQALPQECFSKILLGHWFLAGEGIFTQISTSFLCRLTYKRWRCFCGDGLGSKGSSRSLSPAVVPPLTHVPKMGYVLIYWGKWDVCWYIEENRIYIDRLRKMGCILIYWENWHIYWGKWDIYGYIEENWIYMDILRKMEGSAARGGVGVEQLPYPVWL